MFDKGKYKFELFLVSVVYLSLFITNKSILLTTNITKEYIYWEGSGNIFNGPIISYTSLYFQPLPQF
jgi:hypothetical protein